MGHPAEDFYRRALAAVGIADGATETSMSLPSDPRVALAEIRLRQKELRALRKEVQAAQADVRMGHTNERAQIGRPSFWQGALRGMFGYRTVTAINQARRGNARDAKVGALAPYEQVKRQIDDLLLQLDRAKIAVERAR